MGFLDKFIVVEKEQPEMSADDIKRQLAEMRGERIGVPTVEMPEGVNLAELITVEQVYEKFGLTDTSKSIFKVEEFSKALPDTLATDVKRAAVIGILAPAGLQVEVLVADATSRLDALNTTIINFATESDNIVNTATEEIAQLEAEINAKKQIINDRKLLQEQEEALIKVEVDKVQKIVNFIQPA